MVMDDSARIALIDVDGQLATVAPDGSHLTRLTHGGRVYQFPAWAPDNRSLAAIGGTEWETGVYVAALDGDATHYPSRAVYVGDSQAAGNQPPIYLSWAPDGAALAVLTAHPDLRLALQLVNAGGENAPFTAPVLGGQPCFWHWHADGHGLLAHVDLGRQTAQLTHVRWRSLDKPTLQPIGVRPGYFQAPGISHDGRLLAYAQATAEGDSQLVVAARDRRMVIGEYGGVTAFNWSPKGDQLAFIHPLTATEHFYGPLHIWRAATEQVQRLSAETVLAFFWAPDGRQIAYFTAPTGADFDDNGNLRVNGHFNGGWPFPVQPTPARLQLTLHVVESATGQTRKLLTFAPAAPLINQYLPFFDQYAKSHPIWSPASDALVLPVEEKGRLTVQVVPVAGGKARTVAEGTMATWSW